jgi:hypothetical protein
MRDSVLLRLTLTASLSITTPLLAQSHPSQISAPPASTLPATATTPAPATPAAPLTPAQTPARRAELSFANNQLTIKAANSSLNQILREISRLTGLKITGGVADERVFGNYGPDTTNNVLRDLLDGTASNMLIVSATGSQPAELILTPRTGGATPPNPNASRFDDARDEDRTPPNRPAPPQPNDAQQSTPAPQNATPQPIQPPADNNNSSSGISSAPNAFDSNSNSNSNANSNSSTDANSSQQSPNGTKTPQQIFDELQKLRQQQSQQQQSSPQ